MQVDYLVLADAAAASEGKHYIHGAGWDTLFVASFPVLHPLVSVAVRLRVPWTETNQPHTIELDVVDEDGRSILPDPPGTMNGTIDVGRPPYLREGTDQVFPLVMNIQGLRFSQAGTYAVLLRVDRFEAARSTFRVVPISQTMIPTS